MNINDKKRLEVFAARIRLETVKEFISLGFGHIGGSLSIADLLAVLYGKAMRIDPQHPQWPERDKLVVSKGHSGPAVYAALALKGYFPMDWLRTLNRGGTNLPSHCDRNKTPGIDATTGSLGQGASQAVGIALADKLSGYDNYIYLIVGDGELEEGQTWEAVMFSAAHELQNLIVFVDNNKKQLDGCIDEIQYQFDIPAKFAAFGFDTQFVQGHDVEQIYEAIENAKRVQDKPHAIILDTVKGKGVPEVEQTYANHSLILTEEQKENWLRLLTAAVESKEKEG